VEDRLEYISRKLRECRAYWSAYNPASSYLYDVEDADDDLQWLVREVTRLRAELARSDGPGTPGGATRRPPRRR
jgi:hypothetical protein